MSGSPAVLERWLNQVANRVRLRRALLFVAWGLVGWGAAAVALLVVARVVPLGWEEPVVVLALPAVALAAFAIGLTRPLPRDLVARAADRDLRAADRLGTAAEFDPRRGIALEDAQAADAARYASAHRPGQAAPFRVPERRLAVAAALALAAGALLFTHNPMDDVLERRAAERELLEAAAEDVERGAREVEGAPIAEAEKRRLLTELNELSDALREAPSIEEAMRDLLTAQRRLAAMQNGDHIATKTLTQSFERSLQDKPLSPGNSGSAAEQLAQLAADLDGLSAKERAAASERLDELARSLEPVDPALAAAIEAAAAAAVEGGDPRAVARAADALTAAQASIAAQEAIAASGARLGTLREQLAAASAALAQGQGQGQGPGQGVGQGQGQGQGQGSGQGQGQGSGQGQGQGQGAGNPSGNVGGTNANSSTGATGGAGQANGTGNNPSKPGDDAPVFDPVFGDEIAERLRVSGGNQGGRSTELGTQIGGGRDGEILIPYSYVYPEWSARAARSVDTLAIPASLRAFVRAYFRSLAPEEGR